MLRLKLSSKPLKKCGINNALVGSGDDILFDDSDVSNSNDDPDELLCFEDWHDSSEFFGFEDQNVFRFCNLCSVHN